MKRFVKTTICIVLLVMLMLETDTIYAKETSIAGIDVSWHNGEVNWETVSEQGISFVMIKTGNGKEPEIFEDDIDAQFEANYEGAGMVGIKRGVYHLCCTRTVEGAKKEAEYCLKILNGRELEYPVAYDMEQAGTFAGGIENTTAIAKAFCDIIEEAGYKAMIYAPVSRLKTDFNLEELSNYKIWVAHYDVEKPDFTYPYDIWQYTQHGVVEGANNNNGNGTCDMNYSYMFAESISINKSSITLGKGETFTLKTVLEPENTTDKVSYSSNKKTVVTVSKTGKITAKGVGKAVITVKTGSGLIKKCTVTVKKAPSSVKLQTTVKTLKTGKTYQLKPSIASGTANYKYSYSSNKKAIATVTSSGKITAKKKGIAYITVKTFNNKLAKIKIIVK